MNDSKYVSKTIATLIRDINRIEQFCGFTAIGIGIKQVASSNQEMSLLSSDFWLILGSVSSRLFIQAVLHLVAVEDSDIEPKTRRKWATYRIISGIIIISVAILNLELFPVHLMDYFGIYMCSPDSS